LRSNLFANPRRRDQYSIMSKLGRELIPTRQSLLSRLKDLDDQESWKDFFNTYWKLIYGVALKAGLTETESQDVVQETVICVSKKMQGFRYDPSLGSFKAWLMKLTHWRIVDQFRKRQREHPGPHRHSSDDEGTATVEQIPDPASLDLNAVWDAEWQKSVLEAAIEWVKRQVSPRQYQIFDLYVMQKWPLTRITSALGVNAGQVYLAKHRVSVLLKKQVKFLEAKRL